MKNDALKDKALQCLQTYLVDMEELQSFREYADRAYMGEPVDAEGNELEAQEGRSQVKMSDVMDTVEWIMPTLMRIFYGGQKVVEMRPVGREDESKAPLMEGKVNFDFMRQNNGFVILYDWFKDAMLSKVSTVKYWWEDKTTKKKTSYQGLTAEELLALRSEENFEVKSLKENVVAGMTLYDVEGFRLERTSRPVAEPLPPEEAVFDVNEKAFGPESFFAHRKRCHKNYLKSKYKVAESVIEANINNFDGTTDALKDQRFADLGGRNYVTDNKDSDHVYIYECYLPDYDADGQPVPMKVVVFGEEVLHIEENTYGKPPFCVLSAIRKPHRAVGLSLSELVMELQRWHTSIVRAINDNFYYQNNGVQVVNPYRIDMDDVIDHNHPGAKWRTQYDVDPRTAIFPVPVNPLPQQALALVEMIESAKENRTGVTKYNQGLDSKSLNKTATGISQIMSASQQRMELIARIFAETGVKDLFQAFVDMNIKFFDGKTAVKLNDEWANITPDMIDGKFDILIDVGVGTGTNEVKIGQMMNMMNVSVPAMEMGIVSPDNVYNMIAQVWELMGYKNTDKYVTKPQQQGLPPQLAELLFKMLAQQGVDVNALLQAATQALQTGAGGGRGGSPASAGAPSGQGVLPTGAGAPLPPMVPAA